MRKILYATILSAALGLCSCASTKPQEEVKLESRELSTTPIQVEDQSAKTQKFLEEIIQEHKVPNVADIIYYHESNRERYCEIMKKEYGLEQEEAELQWIKIRQHDPPYDAITIIPRHAIGQGKKSVIVVLSSTFSMAEKKEDLLSFIIDHEGFHARDNAEGIEIDGHKITSEIARQMWYSSFEDILEIRAYTNQIEMIDSGKRKASFKCGQLIGFAYTTVYKRVLERAERGDPFALNTMLNITYFPFLDLIKNKVFVVKREEMEKVIKKATGQ